MDIDGSVNLLILFLNHINAYNEKFNLGNNINGSILNTEASASVPFIYSGNSESKINVF